MFRNFSFKLYTTYFEAKLQSTNDREIRMEIANEKKIGIFHQIVKTGPFNEQTSRLLKCPQSIGNWTNGRILK